MLTVHFESGIQVLPCHTGITIWILTRLTKMSTVILYSVSHTNSVQMNVQLHNLVSTDVTRLWKKWALTLSKMMKLLKNLTMYSQADTTQAASLWETILKHQQ